MSSIITIINNISDIGIKRLYKFILRRVVGRYFKVLCKYFMWLIIIIIKCH